VFLGRSCRRLHAARPRRRGVLGGSPLWTRLHCALSRGKYRIARLRAIALTLPARTACSGPAGLSTRIHSTRDRCRLASSEVVLSGCPLTSLPARSTGVIDRWLPAVVLSQSVVLSVGFSTVSQRPHSNRPGKPQGPPGGNPAMSWVLYSVTIVIMTLLGHLSLV
jgi:hypothetical protein